MQLLVTEEWASNEEIYSAFLHNSRGPPDANRLVVISFGYMEMILPGLEGTKETWAGACKLNGKFGHVEKHLIKAIMETKPKEANIWLSQSPCAECCESLLDLVSSMNIKLKISFTSVFLHHRASEARALARLAHHPRIEICAWGKDQWKHLTAVLGMTQGQVLEDPERDHWDGEWATVIMEIITEEITAHPLSGNRTIYYKPKPYRGKDGLLNAMDRLAFS